MKRLLLCLCVCGIVAIAPAAAQTTTLTLNWDQQEALTTVVAGFTYTLKVDANPVVAVVPTCVASGASTRCTAPFLATSMVGGTSHTVVLTATNAFGSTSSDPLTGAPPSKPSGFTIKVVVTIP